MTVDRSSWHTRIYLWWYAHKYGSWHIERKTVSNLCPYMRVVMFWAPIRAIFWDWIRIFKVPLNAITIPSIVLSLPFLLGYLDYHVKLGLWILYGFLLAASIIIGLIAGVVFTLSEDGLGWWDPLTKPFRSAANAPKTTSFFALVREYLRSAHDRVCPEVDFQ